MAAFCPAQQYVHINVCLRRAHFAWYVIFIDARFQEEYVQTALVLSQWMTSHPVQQPPSGYYYTLHTITTTLLLPVIGWWRGVVGNAFWLKRSYSTPGPVSTAMGDCLRAGKPSRCEACQPGRLSLLPSVGR